MINKDDLIKKNIIINNKLKYPLKLSFNDENEIINLILDFLNGKKLDISIKTKNQKIAFELSKYYLEQNINLN